ncbi:hypothetical protein DFH29DRAFT_880519 [Suillus ampliporus]|nr:hypothetical protein DFH29DRAFT_880519 [Suillus ampliporus]
MDLKLFDGLPPSPTTFLPLPPSYIPTQLRSTNLCDFEAVRQYLHLFLVRSRVDASLIIKYNGGSGYIAIAQFKNWCGDFFELISSSTSRNFCNLQYQHLKSSFPHIVMGVKTASSHLFSILPRLGFPPSHKMESSSRSPCVDKPEEDWYIPYNGPLEPPKSVSLAKQDIVRHPISQDNVNTHLEDSQLLYRYQDMSVNDAKPLGLGPPPVQLAGYPRTRIHSDLTRRTASSSSAIDPTPPHPRWHQKSAPRLQILTHASMDAGVGKSPMPAQHIGISTPQKKK